VLGCNGNIIEDAIAHCLVGLCMMPGWPAGFNSEAAWVQGNGSATGRPIANVEGGTGRGMQVQACVLHCRPCRATHAL
jgi:hypothetical protein